jgi:hypothetical protein
VSEIALGVKVFTRAEKLAGLLESAARGPIDRVYVADDGERTERKEQLYGREYPFELTVLDLEYDAGLGYGRDRIVEALKEPYLLIVDSDHKVPRNVEVLAEQLEQRPAFGGVSGLLLEGGRITGTCHDLFERDDLLVRDVKGGKQVEEVAGSPLMEFEFLPNVAMFRRECLMKQSWDPNYVIGKEHLDFYVAHKRRTDWRFGVNPAVLFTHRPGGDASYDRDRSNLEKLRRSQRYFTEKWGYRQIVHGQTDWVDPTSPLRNSRFVTRLLFKSVLLNLPSTVQAWGMDLREAVRRVRGRPPL